MGITVAWDNDEKTVLYICYQLPWTVAEFIISQAELRRFMSSVTHTVHLFFDVSAGIALPQNAMSHFREASKYVLPNQGVLILIGANLFAKTVIRVLQTTIPAILKSDEIYFVETREEAQALVRRMREVV
jgi:hypothetical protein